MVYAETNSRQVVRLPSGELCLGGSNGEVAMRMRSELPVGDPLETSCLFASGGVHVRDDIHVTVVETIHD